MAQTARKIETAQPRVEDVAEQAPTLNVAAPDAEAALSPARDLQSRLAEEVARKDDKMSARHVTALVLTVCLATWVGGFLLYATL